MRYYVDGYNLIGKIKQISLSDPQKEAKLVKFLTQRFPNAKDTFVLVFDGHHPFLSYGSNVKSGRFKIKFTPNDQSADDYIIQMISTLRQKTGIVVISSDNEILRAAKQYRVKAIKSEVFLKSQYTIIPDADSPAHIEVNHQDIDYWMDVFNNPTDKNAV